MRVAIPCLYAEYGRYIDKLRAIPYHVDCLKPVERRLLLSLNAVAPNKVQKSAKVVGHCIGNFHPHGDLSTYGALVQLVKRGWVIGQGNFGAEGLENTGAAAMRYTEVKLNSYVKDALFKYVKFVPWAELELESEPLYLPSIVPMGLIGGGLTQGIGFHTVKMPQYEYIDLIKRLYSILTNAPKPTIAPVMNNCNVAEVEAGDYEHILTTGVGSVWVCPKYNVYDTAIDILGKNPINGFSKLKKQAKRFDDMIAIKDLSSANLCIRVYCKIGKVTPQFETGVVDAISTKINYICNVVTDDGRIECKSIDELLLTSYNHWKHAWLKELELQLEKLNSKLFQLTVIQAIRECYDPSQNTVADIVAAFKAKSAQYPGITDKDIETAASKGRIKELIEAKLDFQAVTQRINQVKQAIATHDANALAFIKNMI